MGAFLLEKNGDGSVLLRLPAFPFLSLSVSFAAGDGRETASVSTSEGVRILYPGLAEISLSLERKEGGAALLLRTEYLSSFSSRLSLAFVFPSAFSSVFVPSVWYQDNLRGKGHFPSLRLSPFWSFLETRMSMPGGIAVTLGDETAVFALSPADREEDLASVGWKEKSVIYTIPGKEEPASYRGKKVLVPTDGEEPSVLRRAGEKHERTIFLARCKGNDCLAAWEGFLRSFEPFFGKEEKPRLGWDTYRFAKLARILNLIEKDADGGAYLAQGKGNGDLQDTYAFTSASFLVKGVEAAYALSRTRAEGEIPSPLRVARKRVSRLFGIPDDGNLYTALAVRLGDYYLQAEREPGIFQDCHSLTDGRWGGYLGIGEHPEYALAVNSRCNGEAMKAYLLLARSLEKKGISRETYKNLARRVASFYIRNQRSTGSFGRWWKPDGTCLDDEGTNGAHIADFFCTLISSLPPGDPLQKPLRSSLVRALAYYQDLAEKGLFYGDTLDADSLDKEAGVVLLSLFLDAYAILQKEDLITSARRAASFILSWIWQTDSFIPPSSPLGKRGFSTRGMTAVSVAHHHLDFYGMAIALDFFRLGKITGDGYYGRMGKMMAEAALQLIATDADLLGRDISFWGWQPEQINHTDWDYFNRKEMTHGHFDIDIAWVSVLGYDSCLSLLEEGFIS